MNSALKIVMYHYVRDLKNSRYPNIRGLSTERFKQQIAFLKENFTVVSPQAVIEAANSDGQLPDNACFLTFDDGYIDHYDTVFPILMENDMTAFFSMPGRILTERRLLDVNKIHYILAAAELDDLWKVFKDMLEPSLRQNGLRTMEEYWNSCNLQSRFDPPEVIFIKRMLQVELPIDLRNELTDELFNKIVGVPENAMVQELYMSPEQMRLMKRMGMVFGIHGYEHAWLNRMTHEEAAKDMDMALDAMDGIVDPQGWIMCYPYGSHSDDVERIAKSKGAVLGVTTQLRTADLKKDSPFQLPRLDTNDFPPVSDNYLTL